jgi:cell shape-determining protein MreD
VIVLWVLGAIMVALVAQSGLALLLPGQAALFDPLLLIAVYVSLKRGDTPGMLAGGATGWAQEIVFGGEILGFQGLARVVLGFLIGQAGRRFLLTGAPAQFVVILIAVLLDYWLAGRCAAMFEVPCPALSWPVLLGRMALNAAAGALLFQLAERVEARLERDTLA